MIKDQSFTGCGGAGGIVINYVWKSCPICGVCQRVPENTFEGKTQFTFYNEFSISKRCENITCCGIWIENDYYKRR